MRQIARAVELFNQQEVDLVLHAGDFVAPFAAGEFDRPANEAYWRLRKQ